MKSSVTASTSTSLPQIAGYILTEELYRGARTAVYRAVKTEQQHSVVIKTLQKEYPSFGELVQFRNQYAITKNLPIPGIIHPLSLEAYGNGYTLVMEDWGGISLGKYIQQRCLAWSEILGIGLQLADILHDLHSSRVIHKDIKPSNILIQPESQQIKLIDFSIASLLPKETQEIQNPNTLEGTLAYLAPEQTGRMNRGIDYRADYYTLGVTLYELLTGRLPFTADEPLELLHCHIAKIPPRVNQVNPMIPLMVGTIVAKLMAKNAEDRYQSALGLKHDLTQCLNQWKATGTIHEFELGQRDLSDRFNIPEKLYGRQVEVQTLLDAFERVTQGNSELMLVAGFSGIGKTVVINEVHKPIVKQRGYFIKGKFNQFNRNIPFAAFVQALRDLMGQVLAESDQQLAQWQAQIQAAVGENGQVLIDVIPELEQIIGRQPAVPELTGNAAQNRFNLLFQKFIAVFTTAEHPLVMFLDDLQWADFASLQLIKVLMNDRGYLLMLGAYRDNEVSPAHPLILTLEALKQAGATVETITLAPLALSETNRLIADTFKCPLHLTQPLTQLIDRKTKGNPFFTTQFLKALHEEKLITFNHHQGHWECDIAQVNGRSLTDDVVEFMATELQKLPSKTQEALKLAACIGNQFDLRTLAIVSEQSTAEVVDALWSALRHGLILPQSHLYKFYLSQDTTNVKTEHLAAPEAVTYRFFHDRVQQAAYSLIPAAQKQHTHLTIGQLLLRKSELSHQDNSIFELVQQLNCGLSRVTEVEQRYQYAQLNLRAGQKAKASTAYKAALDYFKNGIQFLPTDRWITGYNVTLRLYESAAETALLNCDFEQMDILIQTVLKNTKSLLDQVKVYEVKLQAYQVQNQQLQAIKIGQEILQKLGVTLPESLTPQEIQEYVQDTLAQLSDYTLEDLINLPITQDAQAIAAARMMTSLVPSIHQANPHLFPIIACEEVNLSLKYGNSPFSAPGYADFGIIVSSVLNQLAEGYRFGQLALQLMEKFDEKSVQSMVQFKVAAFNQSNQQHLQEAIALLHQSYQVATETADSVHALVSTSFRLFYAYLSGEKPLTDLLEELDVYQSRFETSQHFLTWVYIIRSSIHNFTQFKENPDCLGSGDSERQILSILLKENDELALHLFYLSKLILSYSFGCFDVALQIADQGANYLKAGISMPSAPAYYYYDSLTRLKRYSRVAASQQEKLWSQIDSNQRNLWIYAAAAPMNYQHKHQLVEAVRFQVLGQIAEAIEYFDCAIASAKANGYIQEQALSNELAAHFYLDWGKQNIAAEYMQNAYYGYAKWGAQAKVADLETRYPNLLAPILQQQQLSLSATETLFASSTVTVAPTRSSRSSTYESSSSSTSISATLDLATVLKASQTLSSEIELDKLLATLLHTVLTNAGADRGALLMLHDDQWFIEAVATLDRPAQVQSIPLTNSLVVCHRLIHTVQRSLQPVVIVDAVSDPTLAMDAYIVQQQPKSLLCTPIVQQGKLLAILYLENHVSAGAFTRDRIELLNFLCAQAAISLENANVYQKLQASEAFLQLVFNTIPQRIFWKDRESRYLGCNQAFLQDAGLTDMDQIVGKTDFEMVWRECAAQFRADDAAVMESGLSKINFEEPQHRQDGTTLWLRTSKLPLRNSGGAIIGVFCSYEDITPLKAAENLLKQQKQDLEIALQQLQETQLQMVQNEKMATLGNLVAGVAHEINNPMGFLNGSIKNAKDYLQDLFEYLDTYQQQQPPSESVTAFAEEIDLDFLLEDFPKLLDSMKGAMARIKNISTSLRTFSRADTEHKVSANLHEGLDSTLLILKYRLKASENRPAIHVIKEYGKLPEINCFPGQLNQVFMNILANAIDMFDDMAQQTLFENLKHNPQQIKIQTSMLSAQNTVEICIGDNGKGMSEAVQSRIFDHLFTTKGVGKGTGLGLAIAHQIVTESHGGRIEVKSTINQGTEFFIHLPI